MPIYEYECKKCGEIFEVMQKMSDPAPKKHECGGTRIKRVMSRSSFVLKGTGWYVTDYARKGKPDGESEKKADTSEKKTEKKTEKESEKRPRTDAA